jgi:tetratricopeptide (TPR) repeat protein
VEVLQAALGLLKTGSATRARRIYGRLAQDQLREPTAHALKWALGEALLQSAPEEGLALMEEAYSGYPHLRNAQQSTQLLRAYLGAERPAAARRVVMDLAVAAKNDPTQQLPLLECAIAWGDFLYAKGDFRTAADAYAMAENAAKQLPARPSGPGLDPRWAQYQRANALLQLADYQGGLRLLDEIAATDVPWAREAEAKANFTRMEQRLSSAG